MHEVTVTWVNSVHVRLVVWTDMNRLVRTKVRSHSLSAWFPVTRTVSRTYRTSHRCRLVLSAWLGSRLLALSCCRTGCRACNCAGRPCSGTGSRSCHSRSCGRPCHCRARLLVLNCSCRRSYGHSCSRTSCRRRLCRGRWARYRSRRTCCCRRSGL